ncbi:hypothetical protein TorRG33x02_179730 [Trema orientale]|uniref:Uncharacterized protein n=1 Tax=Trema orientale TaxID=63057 RepID=A0A2P5EL38_TREOI|nr:hypothetical protein TorRG33x02_179730 [Trema orientale]
MGRGRGGFSLLGLGAAEASPALCYPHTIPPSLNLPTLKKLICKGGLFNSLINTRAAVLIVVGPNSDSFGTKTKISPSSQNSLRQPLEKEAANAANPYFSSLLEMCLVKRLEPLEDDNEFEEVNIVRPDDFYQSRDPEGGNW